MPAQTILVVDDEARIVETLRLYLEKDGFRVIPAYDGRPALDLFERERPDLIVLDLMLPEISGLDVCRTIRSHSQVPIIMLTARSGAGLPTAPARHEARCGEQPVALTPTEFRLLATMARQPGRVYTRAQLVEAGMGYEFEGYDRTVDSHIKNLRRKLPTQAGCRIVTVHGLGYKLEAGAGEGGRA